MSLKERINKDLNQALKNKQELELSTLRLLNSTIHNKEIEKKYRLRKEGELNKGEIEKEGQLSDEEIINVIFSEVKKRKEAVLEFEKGNRQDLVDGAKREIKILQKYLPEQLSEKEIKKIAKEIIGKTDAKTMKDMGKVMGQLMPRLKGKADGSLVSKIVKELLSS